MSRLDNSFLTSNKRVYVSISRRADSVLVTRVLSYLKVKGIKHISWQGSLPNPDMIDVVIFISNKDRMIGKGQYDEYKQYNHLPCVLIYDSKIDSSNIVSLPFWQITAFQTAPVSFREFGQFSVNPSYSVTLVSLPEQSKQEEDDFPFAEKNADFNRLISEGKDKIVEMNKDDIKRMLLLVD